MFEMKGGAVFVSVHEHISERADGNDWQLVDVDGFCDLRRGGLCCGLVGAAAQG
jgi:hypothetical protein